MLRPIWLAPALALLAACNVPERQRVTDTPRLWLAEALGPSGQPAGAVRVCADSRVREGFARPLPAFGRAICVRERESWRARPGGYVERCQLNERRYNVQVGVSGDLASDFTVDFAMQPAGRPDPGVRQTRRYRLLGPCPPGWRIGDSDRPGDGTRPNVLS